MSRLREPPGPSDHVIGAPDAPAQLVEYGDYECPFCARAHFEVAEVLRRLGSATRYTFRHFPLTQVHPHALLAAQAAEAAGMQGRYWPMHSMLFENQNALTPEALAIYADRLELDTHRFSRELRTGVHLAKVQNDFRCGVRSGAHATPTFFLNGLQLIHGWDTDRLGTAIREVLQRGPATLVQQVTQR
ncbi:MAG TPA: DsbA family protein [Labilithrix sp.]|jgi:protein-disulfide isomerase|nr:DsbA family protein [Labilithrix sp.]